MARAADKQRAIAAQHDHQVAAFGHFPRGKPCAADVYAAVSRSQRTAIARAHLSHASSRGTTSHAAATFGLEHDAPRS
jgi:hypothetical protein